MSSGDENAGEASFSKLREGEGRAGLLTELLNAPHSQLTTISPPRAAAGKFPSLTMLATCSTYAPLVPVPKMAPRMQPPAV